MMSHPSAVEFLESIRQSGLLTQARLSELAEWLKSAPGDPTSLGREIHRRGWLTSFQIKEIYRGRGKQLHLGPYVLVDLIGEGGMGRVFKARHTRLNRDAALKVIRKDKLQNPQTIRRFKQEVQAAAQLSHPNVVLAFDADEIDGNYFIAMEYIDGIDLTRMVKERGPLPVPQACEFIRQAALGLHHAHERGLVHRDVKPSNLLTTKNGHVKVLDLGLAMLNQPLDGEEIERVTMEGYVLGTPDFLAPEQARNPQNVDTRADVYSLGGTLYFLLTGKVPYEASSATEKMLRHVMDAPPVLLKARPDAPETLDALIQWSMAKKPEDRPQTPLQLAAALLPYCNLDGTGKFGSSPSTPQIALPKERSDPFVNELEFGLPSREAPAQVRERQVTETHLLRNGLITASVLLVAAVIIYFGFQIIAEDQRPLPKIYTNDWGIKLVLLQPGTFRMGSPDSEAERQAKEGPVAEVTLTQPFYMSATEISNGQFSRLMNRTPSAAAGRARSSTDLPVESVTWEEAREFCRRLTELDSKIRRGWSYRLPTEAEWEYAARAGTSTPFAFGTRVIPVKQVVMRPDKESPYLQGDLSTIPSIPARVGVTEANPFGLHDLHGNVAEWCQDYFDRGYPAGPRSNPTGPETGDLRVVRGGGWDTPVEQCRSAARRGLRPDARDSGVGFRVVLVGPMER